MAAVSGAIPGTPASTGSGAATEDDPVGIRLALPKGRMMQNVIDLLNDAGIKVNLGSARAYRPVVPLKNYDTKLLKPQNILGMLETGSRDIGFAGRDWVEELGADVVEVMDTEMDPVRLVVAAPDADILEKGVGAGGRRLIVASEYAGITKKWIETKKLDASMFRAYGATESLPPEDADCILDNTATGSTLKANGLHIIDVVMTSSTRLFASKAAMDDPAKRARIDSLKLLLQSVLDARSRRMVTVNIPDDKLEEVVAMMPSMRAPTVMELKGKGGYHAVQSAVPQKELPHLIPALKEKGAMDIIVQPIGQIIG